MTIRKGETWGSHGPAPSSLQVAAGDHELALLVAEDPDLCLGVSVAAGDLLATVGGTPNAARPRERASKPSHQPSLASESCQRLPIDLGYVRLDNGEERPFVAHVIAKRLFWQGECAVVMNAAWRSTWYLGPRAHPNDGLLDITVGSLGWQDRIAARKRVRSGTHLPHPGLRVKRVSTWEHEFSRALSVSVDGVGAGKARRVSVRVVEDAFILIL